MHKMIDCPDWAEAYSDMNKWKIGCGITSISFDFNGVPLSKASCWCIRLGLIETECFVRGEFDYSKQKYIEVDPPL